MICKNKTKQKKKLFSSWAGTVKYPCSCTFGAHQYERTHRHTLMLMYSPVKAQAVCKQSPVTAAGTGGIKTGTNLLADGAWQAEGIRTHLRWWQVCSCSRQRWMGGQCLTHKHKHKWFIQISSFEQVNWAPIALALQSNPFHSICTSWMSVWIWNICPSPSTCLTQILQLSWDTARLPLSRLKVQCRGRWLPFQMW